MRRRVLAAAAGAAVTTAAVATQVLLPSLAEDRLRGELETMGSVSSVEVSATPAVKTLFGAVDSVRVVMSEATLDQGVDPEIVAKADEVDALDARVDRVRAGPVDLAGVRLAKQGERLDASGSLSVDQLEELVPGAKVRVDRDGTILLDLSSEGSSLPFPVSFRLEAEDGAVVARPQGQMAGMLPAQPLLERPDLAVESLRGRVGDGRLMLSAEATLTGA